MQRVFVFLHSAKSGGSSFWHALADQASKFEDRKIHVVCTHNTSIKLFGRPDRQRDAAVEILRKFREGNHKGDLLMHYHGPGEDLDSVFSEDMKPLYILLLRDPAKRLRSAFKWYMITEVRQDHTNDPFVLDNFFNVFLSHGYDRILPSVLGVNSVSSSELNDYKSRLVALSLEDFNTKGPSFIIVCKSLGIEIFNSIVYEETVTDTQVIKPKFPSVDNLSFWDKFNHRICMEEHANSILSLLENNSVSRPSLLNSPLINAQASD
jgi:hypothetical protein